MIALVAAAASAGCATESDRGGASAADIGWLERLAARAASTSRAGQEVGRVYLAVLGGTGDRDAEFVMGYRVRLGVK